VNLLLCTHLDLTTSNIGVGVDIANTVTATVKYLHKQYKDSRFVTTEDDWPPYQSKHYTTLALIHNRGKSPDAAVIFVTRELAVAGNIATTLSSETQTANSKDGKIYSRTTKNISDIFVPVPASDGSMMDPNVVLIEGAPGIGKTVLAKEIAFQWTMSKLLTAKKLLFLVFLRECNVNNLKSIEDFVQYVVKSKKIVSCLSEHIFLTQGKDIAIVFDGYDEISDENRKKSFIADVIHRKVLSQCCIVITSHPTASSHLHNLVDCRVEIVGFTEEDRFDYIRTALEDKDHQVKALQQYLQSNPTINALCYIPLNMTILLCLTGDGLDRLPKTQTEMYRKFIEMTIRRFVKKTDDKEVINIDIAELPYPHNEVFTELAKLAYEALKTDTIVFTLAEIRSSCPNLTIKSVNWNGLGLLKAVQYFNVQSGNEEVTFHFLHFSIQEYMAAYYISTMASRKQVKLLKKTFWEHRYYNTWIMYVGITSATSFALKHFLSDHNIQLYTKIFSTFKLSNKLLKDKVKCLHLFQCLEESESKDVAALAGKFLEGQEIDLSDQTLLPSDLNTIGFFLCRSITKQWETLNLSRCNIGVTGCDILCNRLLDKESRDIITIKKVDLSYNQLTFLCFPRLCDLFKSWHTSQVIINDDTILNDITIHDLFISVEEKCFLPNFSDRLEIFIIGSFLFAKCLGENKTLDILSRVTGLKSLYLMQCNWEQNAPIESHDWQAVLNNQNLSTVHVVGTNIKENFIQEIANALVYCDDPINLFVYDPFLSDEFAERINHIQCEDECYRSLISDSSVLLYKRKYEFLFVSRGKVCGVINNSTISKLSPLELLNLGVSIKNLNLSQVCLWKETAKLCGTKQDFILHALIEHIWYKNICNWQLKVLLLKDNTLFAFKAAVIDIVEAMSSTVCLQMFISHCDLRLLSHKNIFNQAITLCIINCHLSNYAIKILHAGILNSLQELFIKFSHTDDDLVQLVTDHYQNISVLLVANGMMIGHNPTAKQIALAFQLEPSITVWKLPKCQVTNDQLTSWLTNIPNNWTELDFEGCRISDVECEIIHQYLNGNDCHSSVKTLNISSSRFTTTVVPKLVDILLIWNVQDCIIDRTDENFCKMLFERLRNVFCYQKRYLRVTRHGYTSYFVYSAKWNEIPLLDHLVQEVYLVNCHIPSVNLNQLLSWLHKTHVLKFLIFQTTLSEAFFIAVLKKFLNSNLELSLYDSTFSNGSDNIYNLISHETIPYQTRMSFLMLSTNCVCGFNVTQHQLQLLQQFTKKKYSTMEWSFIKEITFINETKLFIFRNKLIEGVHFVGKEFMKMRDAQLTVMHKYAKNLKRFGIDNYCSSDKGADTIAAILSDGKLIEEVHLNDLPVKDVTKIVMGLRNNSTLKTLSFTNNHVTHLIFHNLATILSHNPQLQVLDLSNTNFTLAEIDNVAKVLQKCKSLKVLRMANSNVNGTAAKILKAVFYYTAQLEELDLSCNNLQAKGSAIICKALITVSTLTKILLSSNNITDKAADDIAEFLSTHTELQVLDLGENQLQAKGVLKIVTALQMCSKLEVLRVTSSDISNATAELIAYVIKSNNHLQELDLSNNNLKFTGYETISKALQKLPAFTSLFLSGNNINEKVAKNLEFFLLCNTQINELDLSGNNLSTTACAKICRSLQRVSMLTKLYLNSNNITANDISIVLAQNAQLKELDLSENNLQDAGCEIVCKVLSGISTLTKLFLIDNNISDKAAKHIATVLSQNMQIKELDLSRNNLRNVGCIIICKALQKISTLTKLSFRSNNISDSVALMSITNVLSSNTGLKELDLSGNNLQTTGYIVISGISTLTKLYLNNNKITDRAAKETADGLSQNTQLKELNLSGNNLTSEGCIFICKALQKISTIRKLSLNEINIDEEAADDLATVLSQNKQIKELDFSNNNLQNTGCAVIFKALRKVTTLTKILFSCNNITEEAAYELAAVLSCSNMLQALNLDGNFLHVTGTKKIFQGLQHTSSLVKLSIQDNLCTGGAAHDIADVIYHNAALQELDLQGNNLQTEGAIVIAKALQNISTLVKLNIDNNEISDEAVVYIKAILSCNTLLEVFYFHENWFTENGIMLIETCMTHTIDN